MTDKDIDRQAHLRVIKYFLLGFLAFAVFIGGMILLGEAAPAMILLAFLVMILVGVYKHCLDQAKADIQRKRDTMR